MINGTKLTRDHHLWTKDKVKNISGDVTLDIVGDLNIESAGGNIVLKPSDQNVYDFQYDRLYIRSYADADDYFSIHVDDSPAGKTTMATVNDNGDHTADLVFNIDGDITFAPGASNVMYILPTTKTASGNFDSSLTVSETLNLNTGADGDDTHYGIRYAQTQTDLTGWDKVYLMHLYGGDAARTFAIQADGKVGIGESAPQDTLEVNGTVLVKDALKFTQDDGNEFIDSQNDGYLDIGATTAIRLEAPTLCEDKLYFTQTDGNEYIDSLNDGYLDLDATTAIRLKADVEASGDIKVTDTVYFAAETTNTCDSSGGSASATINWNTSQKQKLTITGTSNTIDFTDPSGPCNLILKIVQGDGSDTITAGNYHTNVKWAGGTKPTLSTANGAIDIISFYFDGTSYHGVGSIGFATV